MNSTHCGSGQSLAVEMVASLLATTLMWDLPVFPPVYSGYSDSTERKTDISHLYADWRLKDDYWDDYFTNPYSTRGTSILGEVGNV